MSSPAERRRQQTGNLEQIATELLAASYACPTGRALTPREAVTEALELLEEVEQAVKERRGDLPAKK